MEEDGLIYDWNTAGKFSFPVVGKITLDDETLRDDDCWTDVALGTSS